jgi:E3 ubiquitin-protein ligase RNF1/2
MAKRLVCAGLVDSDAEDDGGADSDSEFSQSDGGGTDE